MTLIATRSRGPGAQVIEAGFPDHRAPPLHLLWSVCHTMDSWLSANDDNIVAVHCLAGKVGAPPSTSGDAPCRRGVAVILTRLPRAAPALSL